MKKLAYIWLFVLFFPVVVGCEVVPFVQPIVDGYILWKEGEASKYYNNDTDVLYRAVKHSLNDMHIAITRDRHASDGDYRIIAGDEDRFQINIRKASPVISEVKIRINFMGDKTYAEMIYTKIDTHLDRIEFKDGKPSQRRFPIQR